MAYQWKTGFRVGVNANAAGKVFEQLSEEEGGLTAKRLVEASRSEDAPLHRAFTWDNDKAAELYRQDEARNLIRHLTITVDTPPVDMMPQNTIVRAFVPVEIEGVCQYVNIRRAVEETDLRAQLLDDAKRELDAFVRKYNTLKELASVIDAINGLLEEMSA